MSAFGSRQASALGRLRLEADVLILAVGPTRTCLRALTARRHANREFHFFRALLGAAALDFVLGLLFFDLTFSGRALPPVSRFHSSKVSGLIFPSTNSCANLRRCALLLKGMRCVPSRRVLYESLDASRPVFGISCPSFLSFPCPGLPCPVLLSGGCLDAGFPGAVGLG